jgi:hypothetical protein
MNAATYVSSARRSIGSPPMRTGGSDDIPLPLVTVSNTRTQGRER